jgi:hypothetical protein
LVRFGVFGSLSATSSASARSDKVMIAGQRILGGLTSAAHGCPFY